MFGPIKTRSASVAEERNGVWFSVPKKRATSGKTSALSNSWGRDP